MAITKRKSRTVLPVPTLMSLRTALVICHYIAIWIMVPMMVGFVGMLALLHTSDDASGATSRKRYDDSIGRMHFDMYQVGFIGNSTLKGYRVAT